MALFGRYGSVRFVRLACDQPTGRSKGYGFVEFSDNGAADAALLAMTGLVLRGRTVRVTRATEQNEG